MEYSENALARLILVDVTWSRWEPGKDKSSYERLIKTFLRVPAAAAASAADGGRPGQVYMHQCYERDKPGNTTWIEPVAAYELPPKDRCRRPSQWLNGDDALERIESIPEAERPASGMGPGPVHGIADWGGMFRTRIFMDADCYCGVVKCDRNVDYWVLIDMRFQRVTQSSVLWHTSLSLWSDPPRSRHHCPPGIEAPPRRRLLPEDACGLLDDWAQCRRAFRKLAHAETRTPLRVFGRSYWPPRFLVSVPEVRPREPAALSDCAVQADGAAQADGGMAGHGSLAGNGGLAGNGSATSNGNATADLGAPDASWNGYRPGILRHMSHEVLWTRNYEAMPRAMLKGGVTAFRRFLPIGEVDAPRYLLVPDVAPRSRPQAGLPSQEDANAWRGIQEEATAAGVLILTDLEAYAASELRGIDSRMRIRENHLRIYQAVAEQAGTLWDALARLLPDARRRRLDRVHRSIELIHQTLLQGVADLDQLVRNIDDSLSHIRSTADEVADQFDRQLGHPSPEEADKALRESLRGGHIDRLRRHVTGDRSTAARVAESYSMLLETIGMAFDERRVREGDRLQRPGVSLALAFGVLGLSGVAQATLPLPTISGAVDLGVRLFLWVLTGGAFLLLMYQVVILRSLGRVATPDFEGRYRKVRRFLADVSTDRLNNLQRSHPRHDPEHGQFWKRLDRDLCDSFVTAWDIAETSQRAATANAYDAASLRSRVENWTLQTLMLTERPRDFSRYSLPYLTALYRICSAKALENWHAAEEIPNAFSAVGETELEEALTRKGCKWLNSHQDKLMKMDTAELRDYLCRQEVLGRDPAGQP